MKNRYYARITALDDKYQTILDRAVVKTRKSKGQVYFIRKVMAVINSFREEFGHESGSFTVGYMGDCSEHIQKILKKAETMKTVKKKEDPK